MITFLVYVFAFHSLIFIYIFYFSDAFEAGFVFVSGGELAYPSVPEQSSPECYRRFTAVLVTICQINDKVSFYSHLIFTI